MNQPILNIACLAIIFSILELQIQCAEGNLHGGFTSSSLRGTTGPANALFTLIDAERPYVFLSAEQQVPVLCVVRAVYAGAPNMEATLEIFDELGLVALVKGKAFFFNTISPSVVYVKNDNSSVAGYSNFPGFLVYQAFEAIAADCDYNCNACSTSMLNKDPSQIQNSAGRSSITFRGIQSASVVATKGTPTAALFEHVKKTLSSSPVSACELQIDKQCVRIVDENPFLLSCPVVNKKLSNSAIENAILNPSFQQKDQFCSYIISQSKLLNQQIQPVLGLHRAILPSVCNSVIVISCYAIFQLFDLFSTTAINFCG